MYKSIFKNVLIVVLAVACGVLAVRVWFGSFSISEAFNLGGAVAQPFGGTQTSDAAAARLVSSARLSICPNHYGRYDFYAHIVQMPEWRYISAAISQLIESGVFSHYGLVQDGEYPHCGFILIEYNFPMNSTFFREYFGTRPGFLSSHFEYFNLLKIALLENNDLEFIFITDEYFYVFSLFAPALFDTFYDIFEIDFLAHEPMTNLVYTSTVYDMSLSGVREHIDYLFPSTASEATVNGIWTYSDSRRIARFLPSGIVEFNSVAYNTGVDSDFTQAILIALAKISLNPNSNDIFLANHYHNAQTNRWHFYFDFALSTSIIDLSSVMPQHTGHAVEIQVLGTEVVSYRRLLMYFYKAGGHQ